MCKRKCLYISLAASFLKESIIGQFVDNQIKPCLHTKPTLSHNIQNIAASQTVSRTHVPPQKQCIDYHFLVTKDLYILKF